ncbi:growth/differentiation factor 10b [Oryzias melastigma]|uniref:Growth differentiation factor 10b n=1 Tax=Oryzias melastigma TaxID=30732 RepID=A0A3B3BQS4_ORYME|nr:growth/differentiation factor 10b [Oryzias melastigma]
MASRLLHLLHLLHALLLLQRSGAHLHAAPRSDAPPDAERRVFTHESPDTLSASMFRLYESYSKEPQSRKGGNTVRSFGAVPRVLNGKDVFQFNLSSIPDSEVVLLASLHFLHKRPRHPQRPWRFRRPRHSSAGPAPVRLLFYGSSQNSALGNTTLASFTKGSWQTGDATAAVRHARDAKEPLMAVEFDVGSEAVQERPPPTGMPYMLVYADDTAIDEPNSVATTLQRYGPGGEDNSASRIRRELHLQTQTNHIPEVHFSNLKSQELWQNTYFPDKTKTGRKQGQVSGGGGAKPQVLSFDERTMKKARRRQWSEPRVCSRRYLRVDFADIGWSEWVLAPKSFDAYYCAGTCGFPIPKVARPSNHATIQSIVRAVGIVPGIPEPCCVPDKVSPLSVLFLDPDRNMVLKVYPGMAVETCACG